MNGTVISCSSVVLILSLYSFQTWSVHLTNGTLLSMFRAVYIRRKCGNKQLSSSVYLTEAEPFLEQYASRSPENQALIGSAGSLVRAEDFLAIIEGGRDEEGDLETERDVAPPSSSSSVKDAVQKDKGLIVFFPGKINCPLECFMQ